MYEDRCSKMTSKICPKCGKSLSLTYKDNILIEHCVDCDYEAPHIPQLKVNYEDKHNNTNV